MAISCLPQDIETAATCLSCLPNGLAPPVITSLLCQWANASGGGSVQDFGVDWTPSNIDLTAEMGMWAFINPELQNITDLTINHTSQREEYDIEGTTSLVHLSFPNLVSFPDASLFFLSNNQALTSLSMPKLVSTPGPSGGGFTIQQHSVLTSLSFPSLTGALGVVLIEANVGLTSVSFPALTHTDAAFSVDANSQLTSLSLPNLVDVNSTFTLDNNDGLGSVSLPSVTHIDGDFNFSGLTAVTSLSLPACLHTAANVFSFGNSALTTVTLNAALTVTTGTQWAFPFCALNQASVDLILHRWNNSPGITGGTVDLSGGTNSTPSASGLADKAALIGKGVTVNTN